MPKIKYIKLEWGDYEAVNFCGWIEKKVACKSSTDWIAHGNDRRKLFPTLKLARAYMQTLADTGILNPKTGDTL